MSKIVLCADDSVTMQTVAEMSLRASPFEYQGASSAEEALNKARTIKPVLILADAVMPGKTGYELCAEVKSDPGLASVPVLVVCGNSEAYDAARGSAVGADGHITKPWDSQALIKKLEEVLGAVGDSETPAPTKTPAPSVAASSPMSPAAMAASLPKGKDPRTATLMGMPAMSIAPLVAPKEPALRAAKVSGRAPTPTPTPVDTVPTAPAPAPLPPMDSAPVVAAAAEASPEARAPMIAGDVTRTPSAEPGGGRRVRPASIPAVAAKIAQEAGLDPAGPEMGALLKLSQAVVERIVWEIVPELAETIIREHIERLSAK